MGYFRLACVALFATVVLTAAATAQPSLHGALLPSSRTVATDAAGTAFFTVLNSGDTTATNCTIQTSTTVGSSLDEFTIATQRTAAAVGTGPLNPSFNIAPNERIDFVVGVTRNAGSLLTDAFVDLHVACDSDVFSLAWPMLTRFHVQFRDNAPDIIMITDTVTRDGVAPFGEGRGAVIAVAAVNIGAADAPTGGLSGPAANEASVNLRAEMPLRGDEFLHEVSACETDASGVCRASRQSCVVDGRDDCLSVSIGDSPATLALFVNMPADGGESRDPAWRRLQVIAASGPTFSRSSSTVALGGLLESATRSVAGAQPQLHINAAFRNTADPTGAASASGRGVLLPDGTGLIDIVRAVDRGAFVQLTTQPVAVEYSFDSVSGAISLDNLFFLDSREGDASRPGDYFHVPASRLTCSLQPESGGRCSAPAAPGGEQIAGEPFRVAISPAEALQRIDNLSRMRGVWPDLIASRVSAPGFATVELNYENEIGQASGGSFYTWGYELVLDGCPIQVVLVQEEVGWLDERYSYRALVTIPADPDLCDPLSPLGVIARGGGTLENGQYAFTLAAIVGTSGSDAEAAQVSFTLTSDIEQSDAVTRRIVLDVKRPPSG